MILYILGFSFTVGTAVLCVKRGQANPWLWIILLFPTVGATVYLLSEVLGSPRSAPGERRPSKRELAHAESEVRRLDNEAAWTEYAQILRRSKRYREAREAAETALVRDPESDEARYELALAQMGDEDFARAADTLERLLKSSPEHDGGEAAYARAVALQKSGRGSEARTILETLARTTSLPKVLFSLAALQADAGQRDDARRTLERIVDEAEYVPSYHRQEVRPWVKKAKKALAAL